MNLFDDLPPLSTDKKCEPKNLKRKLDPEIIETKEKVTKSERVFSYKGYLCSKKGERNEMQDAHILINDFKELIQDKLLPISEIVNCAFYGVYDGHNGVVASDYAADNLHKYLAKTFPKGSIQSIDSCIKRIIVDAYISVENDILKILNKQRPPLRDGSTAVTVLIINNFLYIGNLGDSRAVLGRMKPNKNPPSIEGDITTLKVDKDVNDEEPEKNEIYAIPLTKDHNALDIEERNRIIATGSFVKDGRVCGLLEVSRSFGDIPYKKLGVIALPDVKKCRLAPTDKFLIIACDGVWKVFTGSDAVKFVYDILQSDCAETEDERYNIACTKLVNEAILRMSGDNVTVILVALTQDSNQCDDANATVP